jgi:hypothetical protein
MEAAVIVSFDCHLRLSFSSQIQTVRLILEAVVFAQIRQVRL